MVNRSEILSACKTICRHCDTVHSNDKHSNDKHIKTNKNIFCKDVCFVIQYFFAWTYSDFIVALIVLSLKHRTFFYSNHVLFHQLC